MHALPYHHHGSLRSLIIFFMLSEYTQPWWFSSYRRHTTQQSIQPPAYNTLVLERYPHAINLFIHYFNTWCITKYLNMFLSSIMNIITYILFGWQWLITTVGWWLIFLYPHSWKNIDWDWLYLFLKTKRSFDLSSVCLPVCLLCQTDPYIYM
jgi:hypothetical protein